MGEHEVHTSFLRFADLKPLMPTPFMHLQIAERILANERLEESPRRLITENYSAFYLGSVAPDYQTICDIPREQTHFYELPPDPEAAACESMLSRYPLLTNLSHLLEPQAVFVAAYCAHLMLDLRWYREVLVPFFIADSGWENHRQRFIVHNTLLTFLDRRAVDSLPKDALATLMAARSDHWLPFVRDKDLRRWQVMLVEQLRPGAMLKTVEIYSARLAMSAKEFADNLADSLWMANNVFDRVPLESVQEMLTDAVRESVDLVGRYLTGGPLSVG